MRAAVALRSASTHGGKHANSGAGYDQNLRDIVGARGHCLVSRRAKCVLREIANTSSILKF